MNELQIQFRTDEVRLVMECLNQSEHLCEHAKRHLKEGLARRLLMIQTSRLKIIEIVSEDRIGVIPGHETLELNVHLNAYYLQLRGALDNAAWALHYQFGLLGDVNEDNSTARKKCDLFSTHFLDSINKDHSAFAKHLKSKAEWARDLQQRRNPAAHRIPLYAVPGIRSPEEEADASAEWQKAVAAMLEPIEEYSGMDDTEENMIREMNDSDVKFETAISHIAKSDQIGHYIPIFVMSGPNGKETREIHPQINSDHGAFLDVIKVVVNELTYMSI